MAAAANPSPRNSGGGDASATLNNPHAKRGAAARGVSSESVSFVSSSPPATAGPSSHSASSAAQGQISNYSSDWSHSKAAAADSQSSSSADDSAAEAQPESSDCGVGSSNAGKKPVWNKPTNGVVEVGPVMGAVSWPALSESTRASPKLSNSDSLKEGSVLVSQGTGIASSSQKQVITDNTNPSLAPNHVHPTTQKSMKRGGGSSSGSVTVNGEVHSNNAGKPGSSVPETSSRDHTHKESGQRGGFGSQSHNGSDQLQQRNAYRRGNGSSHPRGDGSYHHNYGGRRDQDRMNHDRNSHRNFNGRDTHMQPQRVGPRGFMRPAPHSSAPFIPPAPVPMPPFVNPLGYPEVARPMIYVPAAPPPPDSLRGLPMVSPIPPHAMFFPIPDPLLRHKIVNQIDYYFSNENLIKDTFLRSNMDEEGWVSIELIAGFKMVRCWTTNVHLISDAVQMSNVVEVQNGKLRKRDDWRRWIMPRSVEFPTVSSPQSVGSFSHDTLATTIETLSLEEKTSKNGQAEAFLSRSLSGDSDTGSQLSNGEGTGQVAVQAGSKHSVSSVSSSQ